MKKFKNSRMSTVSRKLQTLALKNKNGELIIKNPELSNFWSVNLPWPEKLN